MGASSWQLKVEGIVCTLHPACKLRVTGVSRRSRGLDLVVVAELAVVGDSCQKPSGNQCCHHRTNDYVTMYASFNYCQFISGNRLR